MQGAHKEIFINTKLQGSLLNISTMKATKFMNHLNLSMTIQNRNENKVTPSLN